MPFYLPSKHIGGKTLLGTELVRRVGRVIKTHGCNFAKKGTSCRIERFTASIVSAGKVLLFGALFRFVAEFCMQHRNNSVLQHFCRVSVRLNGKKIVVNGYRTRTFID